MSNYYYYRNVKEISIEASVPEENYYSDVENSYENFERMTDILQGNDVVYLEKITVLGDVDDIITRWKKLVEEYRQEQNWAYMKKRVIFTHF